VCQSPSSHTVYSLLVADPPCFILLNIFHILFLVVKPVTGVDLFSMYPVLSSCKITSKFSLKFLFDSLMKVSQRTTTCSSCAAINEQLCPTESALNYIYWCSNFFVSKCTITLYTILFGIQVFWDVHAVSLVEWLPTFWRIIVTPASL
jgi:hypothetical protein